MEGVRERTGQQKCKMRFSSLILDYTDTLKLKSFA